VTVISDRVNDVGYDFPTGVQYIHITAYDEVRDSADETRMILRARHTITVDQSDGTFTSDDLEPGAAKVRIGAGGDWYSIEIPDSETPIRLWPLIQAGLPVVPELANHIASDGTVQIARVMTSAGYSALIGATTPDPGSVFLVY
jgi:hypothetical protein